MEPLMLLGGTPFSPFRLDALIAACAARLPARRGLAIHATAVYFLETAGPLDAQVRERAAALLSARFGASPEGGFFVTPRKGTISPWSSKASDIFRNCGLTSVRRVERGLHLVLSAADAADLPPEALRSVLDLLHDRMTEGVYTSVADLFVHRPPAPGRVFDVLGRGREAVAEANRLMGLALSDGEVAYLAAAYGKAGRNPTDTELVMFGQVNSEHCRHKIFNAEWVIDGQPQAESLFAMIRHTHACHPGGTLVAYSDNAGVVEGHRVAALAVDPATRAYRFAPQQMDLVMKVETHNHPTAISPYPGAATGVGGEIRDESATGIGSRSKAGLSGFMVSHLRIPGYAMPWEGAVPVFPTRLATPLAIMLEGPIGGAAFGNEFGRPQLTGFFRTFEIASDSRRWGYHKPIMLAGGMGSIRRGHIGKRAIPPGAWIVQLGGPAMRIGLGGGAASSMATGSNDEALDFDSVQRGNAEMERRAQEVIEACTALGDANPILSIHDIGAGGLSNGCPELVEATGATFDLRAVHNEETSMNPMEIWCCEAQERYVLAVRHEDRARLEAICARERCPVAFIGVARADRRLILEDSHFGDRPIDMDIGVLLGKPPRMRREVRRLPAAPRPLDLGTLTPREALERVLRLPAVAAKTFLITIADRSVTGLVHRDQMAGPYQLPIADCAVTASGYQACSGEAMAAGERTPVAVLNAPAAGRLAVGEALTNLAGACIGPIGRVKLSANWMCACGEGGEDARLYDTVRAVAIDLCPRLGIAIPVGKDSLSMRTVWQAEGCEQRQLAPLSLIVSAFAPVEDVRRTLTPDLKPGASCLLLVDLGAGRNRLGASALAQVSGQLGDTAPDLDDPGRFAAFFKAIQELVAAGRLLAYHDRSDGGVAVTLAEMAFGGGRGVAVDVPGEGAAPLPALFSEELGAVLQVADGEREAVLGVFAAHGLADAVQVIGRPTAERVLRVAVGGRLVLDEALPRLRQIWSELTTRLQSLRDNPACAEQEFALAGDANDPGMTFALTYDPDEAVGAVSGVKPPPRVAILREQGINGHVEMAAAFTLAGFEAVDVHMSDLHGGRIDLADVDGVVACGGFSYGDVLGAGSGWARSILYSERLAAMFRAFFERPDSFTLGVCNGCQMVSQLKELIPGAAHWPRFSRNLCEQFEARYATVEILPSPSLFFRGMAGSRLPIAVAHGEGLACFDGAGQREMLLAAGLAAARFVDGRGQATECYPWNPNGSAGGLTAFTSSDGRATILMPHPERGFRAAQLSYRPADLFMGEAGPWMRMFRNAYAFSRGVPPQVRPG